MEIESVFRIPDLVGIWFFPLLGLGLSTALCAAIRFAGRRFGITAKVDFRRKSEDRVPLLGGLAIYLTLWCEAYFLQSGVLTKMLIATLPVVVVGVFDDIYELGAKPKFVAQLLCAALWHWLIPFEDLNLSGSIVPEFLMLGFNFLMIVGLSNAVNFIDGIDGQAILFSVISMVAFALSLDGLGSEMSVAVFSCLGFLIFNLPPAKLYLGDVGSTFLGSFLGLVITLRVPGLNSGGVTLGGLFILSFALLDAVLAMGRRASHKQSPFKGDHDHIHHKLQKLGLSKKQTLVVTCFTMVIAGTTGHLILEAQEWPTRLLITFSSCASLLMFLCGIFYMEKYFAHRFGKFFRPMIERYLGTQSTISFDQSSFKAVLFDLMPYMPEFQGKGIPVLLDFIWDVGQLPQIQSAEYQIGVLGSYSMLCIYNQPLGAWTDEEKDRYRRDFFAILADYGVVKNQGTHPLGLFFYDQRQGEEFAILTKAFDGEVIVTNSRNLKIVA